MIYLKAYIAEKKIEIDPNRGLPDYLYLLATNETVRDLVILEHNNDKITIGELNAFSNQVARLLQEQGIKRGEYVAVFMSRSIDFVVTIFAILKIGAICVLISKDMITNDRLKQLLMSTVISQFITNSEKYLRILRNNGIAQATLCNYRDLYTSKMDISVTLSIDDPAFCVFTSGSSGVPKGVILSHASILNDALPGIAEPPLDSTDVMLMSSPVDSSRVTGEIFYPLFGTAKIVILDEAYTANVKQIIRTIIDNEITTLFMVPSMIKEMIREDDFTKCTTVRYLQSLGEHLSTNTYSVLRKQCNAVVVNVYGQSEAGCCAIGYLHKPEDTSVIKAVKPVANRSVFIVDDYDNVVDTGVTGNVCIGGIGVALGYISVDNEESSRLNTINIDGRTVIRTNDIGYIDECGVLMCLGRDDQIIKVMGKRVSLLEIENTILQTDLVISAVVRNVDIRNNHQHIVALVVSGENKQLSTVEWHNKLTRLLPEYMIPSEFVYLNSIPLNSSGKINEAALIDLLQNTKTEKKITSIDVYVRIAKIVANTLDIDITSLKSSDILSEMGASSIDISSILVSFMETYNCELEFDVAYECSLFDIAEKIIGYENK